MELKEVEEVSLGEQLAICFKEKTGKSVEFFYKTERTKLIWYLRKYCGDNIQLATEIADEAFVKAFEKIFEYDNTKSKFNTWLYTVARNVMLRSKEKGINNTESLDEDFDGENKMKLPVSDLEYEIIESQTLTEKINIVRAGIDALPEKYALILTMREIDGLSYKDISEALDMNDNTVKSRIFVGKKMLLDIIKPQLKEYACN
jgi:RNA polymerase sigma-70 factor (ECF subfamily)